MAVPKAGLKINYFSGNAEVQKYGNRADLGQISHEDVARVRVAVEGAVHEHLRSPRLADAEQEQLEIDVCRTQLFGIFE
eukprot:1808503-Pleurochrysis_carterae.AAC.1